MPTDRLSVHDAIELQQDGVQSEPALELPVSTKDNHEYPSGARLGFITHTRSSIDVQASIRSGVTSPCTTLSGTQLSAVLDAYQEGSGQSHLVSVACGIAAALVAIASAMPSAVKQLREHAAD